MPKSTSVGAVWMSQTLVITILTLKVLLSVPAANADAVLAAKRAVASRVFLRAFINLVSGAW